MDIRFYNTLTHQLEKFEPLAAPSVYIYNCGPTVYDFAHIGNFRTFIFADVLRRFLELTGHNVQQVMNLTDVGHMTEDQSADGGGQDKMQLAAQRLREAKKQGQAHATAIDNPDDPYQVAQFYINAFLDDAKKLGLKIADEYPSHMPRATEHVGRMIEIILKLVENGHAYRGGDGCVYFDVQSFPDYGKLSGNSLDKLRGGAGGRVSAENQAIKKHPADFLLWKPDPSHIMKWESPWGVGYPGWHIECSAMSSSVLGKLAGLAGPMATIDIHTGGEDNIFPHHECEIAQSCGATGKPLFAKYWMHSRHLMVEGEKMSKSKGNFFTVRDILNGKVNNKPASAAALRYSLLRGHYRSTLNFTEEGLLEAGMNIASLRNTYQGLLVKVHSDFKDKLDQLEFEAKQVSIDHPALKPFVEALADDLNIAGAMAAVHAFVRSRPDPSAQSLGVMDRFDDVLGIIRTKFFDGGLQVGNSNNAANEAQRQCIQLDAARAAKDFATADRIRKELIEAGYEVTTTKAGTVARKKLA